MTVYQCDKGHQFVHAAIVTKHRDVLNQHSSQEWDETEIHVCPEPTCQSIHYSEVLQPEPTPLEDMLQVPFEQVKEYLAKGYIELDRKDHVYAKGLVMIKCKEPQKP